MLFRKNRDHLAPHGNAGFTLLELLFSITIFTLLSTVAFVSYRSYERRLTVQAVARDIISVLDTAKSRTLAAKNDISYGVHFSSSSYTLFAGETYTAGDVGNEVHTVNDNVELYALSLTGGDDVLYSRVRGSTVNSGTISLRLVDEPSVNLTISIPVLAPASVSHPTDQADTRITDSRHLGVALGWSLPSSTTLQLVFSDPPNPNVTVDIPIADYLDASSTSFDWQGKTTVSNVAQVLHIYSESITPTSTVLSIRRDGRYNTKALTLYVDGQNILSYDASGAPTLGIAASSMTVE
ncbi:hypothetical protein COV04_00490 [Candidatus Uhrbacteria bacterium CG10_big_fil_rev_8_21_14_0_10_48_11]|uniref:General secretion pathway GspH domain-containing protein n=1 Tax=Candidatus Uhrbacteria bacterium CG10_big_fil_rev_8_21_14_0_10_48_11 TaxID=1975037 RepID=A0A2M8LFK7_9BACT|nr:MAG: hypothetical protein COV04_00490 [Candidatus Uhrbacteria bacterium CG10_big_fil_rev_8_21_14_0_10_48_11]